MIASRRKFEVSTKAEGISELEVEAALRWLHGMVALARVQESRRLVLSPGTMETESYKLIRRLFKTNDERLARLIRSSILDGSNGEYRLRFVDVPRLGTLDLVAIETDW